MDRNDILQFRSYSRCFPAVAYARHTPRVGCATTDGATGNGSGSSGSGSSAVRVVALFTSTRDPDAPAKAVASPEPGTPPPTLKRERQEEREGDGDGNPSENHGRPGDGSLLAGGNDDVERCKKEERDEPQEPPVKRRRHLYVQVQYDRALIETLPIEMMREKHPQILIDYLLSCSVWT